MSEFKNGVMLIENALRCVAQDIELYYKKKAPNGAWCIATCRNAAAQFEQMRSELAELRRTQPENEPLTLDELRQMDGEPVWVVKTTGIKLAWALVTGLGDETYVRTCHGTELWADDYGTTWLAYRRKPERSEK